MNAKERRGLLGIALIALIIVALGAWMQCTRQEGESVGKGEMLYQQSMGTSAADTARVSVKEQKEKKKKKGRKGKKRKGGSRRSSSGSGKSSKSGKSQKPYYGVLTDTMPGLTYD